MLREKAKTIKLIYGLAFGIMSAVLAFLLILQVSDIYFNGGEKPYTVEAIAEHFNRILAFICIWIAIVIAGFVIYEIYPTKSATVKTDTFYTFSVLKKKLGSKPINDSQTYREYEKRQWIVNIVKLICGLCVGVCIVFGIAYLSNSSNFTNKDQNTEVAKAWLYLLPFVLVSFALIIGVSFFEKIVIERQMPLVKQILKEPVADKVVIKSPFNKFRLRLNEILDNKKTISILRLTVAIVGLVLLIYGLATGGNSGVLAKAITICRQCIGLG